MNKRNTGVLLALLLVAGGVVAAGEQLTPAAKQLDDLTLDQALEMAERLQPELAEARALVDAAQGRAKQAGAFPNPEAILGAQQIPFSSSAPNEKEYIAGLGQTVPMGPRLAKARQAELFERDVRGRALEVKRREIQRRVRGAFATALYQENARRVQAQVLQNNEKAVAMTTSRLEAGDALREDLARVEIELARARVEFQRAESLHQQALIALASAMGDAALIVKSVTGALDAAFEIPTLEILASNLSAHPENEQARADIRVREAHLELAKAERVPDVKVELLYHRLESSGENTFDVGLSIPLPLFNRNQGRLTEARADLAAAAARGRRTRNELAARLRDHCVQLDAALANSRTLKDEVLLRADTVLSAAEARYAEGDTSLAEVLPVRREWAEVQVLYLQSLREVMQAWIEIKALSMQ